MRSATNITHKPPWLKSRLSGSKTHSQLKSLVRESKLHTVCEEAKCPNIHECWGERKTITFMILGDICTRACRFYAVTSGQPGKVDRMEPERVARAVSRMQLSHAVITVVARDDLSDGGASIFVETVNAIRKEHPLCTIEVLPSDFGGVYEHQQTLMQAKPDVLNHNIETVLSLSDRVRSMAKYKRSLEFLRRAKEMQPWTLTKSSIMVGLGETQSELEEAMDDLRANNVDILTIGQYIAPTKKHARFLSVEKYWTPNEFDDLRDIALAKGFRHCESVPKVRSSYHADEQARLAREISGSTF